MLTEQEKLNLIIYYRSLNNDVPGVNTILTALQSDILDYGHRFEDLYIATFSHYGSPSCKS
jgi:hypothetical protein